MGPPSATLSRGVGLCSRAISPAAARPGSPRWRAVSRNASARASGSGASSSSQAANTSKAVEVLGRALAQLESPSGPAKNSPDKTHIQETNPFGFVPATEDQTPPAAAEDNAEIPPTLNAGTREPSNDRAQAREGVRAQLFSEDDARELVELRKYKAKFEAAKRAATAYNGSEGLRVPRRAREEAPAPPPPAFVNGHSAKLVATEARTQLTTFVDPESSVFNNQYSESIKGPLMNTLIKARKFTKVDCPEEFEDYWVYEGMGNVSKKTKKQRDVFDTDQNKISGVVMPFLGGREVYGLAWSIQVNQMASAAWKAYSRQKFGYYINTRTASAAEKNKLRLQCAAVIAEKDGIGFRSIAEPVDTEPVIVAIARVLDPTLFNSDGSLPPEAKPVCTLAQAALIVFKIQERLRDPLRQGVNVGASHWAGMVKTFYKLRKEVKDVPCTRLVVVDNGEMPEISSSYGAGVTLIEDSEDDAVE